MKVNPFLYKCVMMTLALCLILSSASIQPAHAQTKSTANTQLQDGITDAWWEQAQETIRMSEYNIIWVEQPQVSGAPSSYQAPNREQNLRFYFQEEGVQIVRRIESQPTWNWDLALVGFGDERTLFASSRPVLMVEANHITYQRDGLGEIYTNTEQGLVQRFKLASRPQDQQDGQLRLALRVSSDLSLRRLADGSLEWQFADQPILSYSNLRASDAQGRELTVQLSSIQEVTSPTGRTGYDLQLSIEDQSASYPLVVEALINSVSPSADWLDLGAQDNAHLGISVATAGDINGDGYSDVIIGAPDYDYLAAPETGMVYVYLGSANGLQFVHHWSWHGVDGDQFGTTVTTAGDVNGDGYSDVIIGAPGYESVIDQDREGKAYLFHGSASGLSSTVNWFFESNTTNAELGRAIAPAGDINNDGYSDVVLGIKNYYDGWVIVFYGSVNGLNPFVYSQMFAQQEDEEYGASVCTAGDVDGDGYADLLVGAPLYDSVGSSDHGRVYLYYGGPTGVNFNSPVNLETQAEYGLFGSSVSTAGDVNGDGYSDVIIGAPQQDLVGDLVGYAFVYHGSIIGINSTPAWYVIGDEAYARLGNSVATAGDVNGDGYADILVGQSRYDGVGTERGRAFLWMGSASGLGPISNEVSSADWVTTIETESSGLGHALGTAGDVNGDGFSDVIIGAPYYSGANEQEGLVQVFYGGPDNLSSSAGWSYLGDYASIDLGASVASAGDINGDGYADIIAGAPYYDSGAVDEGAAFVWHGSPEGPASTNDWWALVGQADARFGFSVASAGDVNGDGYDDVLVGAPFFNNGFGEFDEGMVFLWHGSSSGLGSQGSFINADWKAESNMMDAAFGYSVAGVGDVNGDGYSDILVGAPYYGWYHTNEGRVIAWLGGSGGLGPDGNFSNADWVYESDMDYRYLGYSVAGAGDVNRDGYSDVIAGSLGWAFAWHGSAGGLFSPGSNWIIAELTVGNRLGASVDTAGDINGDGYSDVIVGAPWETGPLGIKQGAAYAYCGGVSGLNYSSCWYSRGYSVNAEFGAAVSLAGDMNGDGYSEIAVGAPGWTNAETAKGSVHLYYGAASGPVSNSQGDWRLNSSDNNARLGAALSGAGDVNGDGFADLLIGAPGINSNRGKVSLYYGNGTPGKALRPRQRRNQISEYPIARLGMTTLSGFIVQLRGFSPSGRSACKAELEYAEIQQRWTETTSTLISSHYTDTGKSGLPLDITVAAMPNGQHVHWRMRIHYSPVTSPFNPPRSRWVHMPWNGWNEADLRSPFVPVLTSSLYLPIVIR